MNKEDIADKILNIQVELSKDRFAKEKACDDAICLINELDEDYKKNAIRAMTVNALIDLERKEDYTSFIEALVNDKNYHLQLEGKQAEMRLLKNTGDSQKILSGLDQIIEIAERNHDSETMASMYLEKGQILYHNNELMTALECYEKGIGIAEESHNLCMVAAFNYYIALVLFDFNHWELGIEKLRESSELAIEQSCIGIAKQSEIMRAYYMLERGDIESSKLILNSWVDNFKVLL